MNFTLRLKMDTSRYPVGDSVHIANEYDTRDACADVATGNGVFFTTSTGCPVGYAPGVVTAVYATPVEAPVDDTDVISAPANAAEVVVPPGIHPGMLVTATGGEYGSSVVGVLTEIDRSDPGLPYCVRYRHPVGERLVSRWATHVSPAPELVPGQEVAGITRTESGWEDKVGVLEGVYPDSALPYHIRTGTAPDTTEYDRYAWAVPIK